MHPIAHRKPSPADLRVRPEHLKELDAIHTLLRELNDPYASSYALTALVARIPVLTIRCVHRAVARSGGREIESLEQVMTLIGNQGLEAELLQLLEDLTIAKADLEDAEEAAAAEARRQRRRGGRTP